MPLLPAEPCLFPPDLFTHPFDPDADSPVRWWVLQTRARAEKGVARACFRGRLPFFLPLYCKEWYRRERRFRAYLPLFPGYVFVAGDREVCQRALKSRLAVQALTVEDQSQLHRDLEQVYRLVHSDYRLTPEAGWVASTPSAICANDLGLLYGRVIHSQGKRKLLVGVEALHCAFSVEFEEASLATEGTTGIGAIAALP